MANAREPAAELSPPFPAQHLADTGSEAELTPAPRYAGLHYKPAGKLEGQVAIVTGADSGIGRAVAVLFAREGADVGVLYYSHDEDAQVTARAIHDAGRRAVVVKGDIGDAGFCQAAVREVKSHLGRLDIVVSNAAVQMSCPRLEDLSEAQLEKTFRTNVFGFFYLIKACLPYLEPGAAIITSGSETGLFGSPALLDYSATKGALHALTRSLAKQLLPRGIRVNAVAPGPVWTPLNPADPGQSANDVASFGESTGLGRPAQPEEIAPAYVFLASHADSSFMTGQVLAELGGVHP